MIIKLENVINESSVGTTVLQIDMDKILKIENKTEYKKSTSIIDPPHYMNYDFCDLYNYYIIIETIDEKIKVNFINIDYCINAINYIYDEMFHQKYTNQDNKFYIKED